MSTQPNTSNNENLIFDVGLYRGRDTDVCLKNGYRVVAFNAAFCRIRFAKLSGATERFVRLLIPGRSNPQVRYDSVIEV